MTAASAQDNPTARQAVPVGMIREPLQGENANVPVNPELCVVLNSPDGAWLACAMPGQLRRCLGRSARREPSGISVTVGEMAAALTAIGGADVAARLSWSVMRPSSARYQPAKVASQRAAGIGFADDKPFIETARDFAATVNKR